MLLPYLLLPLLLYSFGKRHANKAWNATINTDELRTHLLILLKKETHCETFHFYLTLIDTKNLICIKKKSSSTISILGKAKMCILPVLLCSVPHLFRYCTSGCWVSPSPGLQQSQLDSNHTYMEVCIIILGFTRHNIMYLQCFSFKKASDSRICRVHWIHPWFDNP